MENQHSIFIIIIFCDIMLNQTNNRISSSGLQFLDHNYHYKLLQYYVHVVWVDFG